MKKFPIILIAFIVLFLGIGLLVPISQTAPDNTRIILDHTLQVYVSPPCFDQAELTNFLEETTLAQARNVGYDVESTCTEASLVAPAQPFLLQMFRLSEVPWGADGQW